MKKQELQRKLDEATKRRMEISDNILWLKEQLAEAEKPKLRHGDFGYNNLGYPRLILLSKDEELFDAGKLYCDPVIGGHSHPLPDPILGNIFDLMEGWSEPFENWSGYATGIRIEDNELRLYACTGADCSKENEYCTLDSIDSIKRAERFWHKLGHAIAELKRKENK